MSNTFLPPPPDKSEFKTYREWIRAINDYNQAVACTSSLQKAAKESALLKASARQKKPKSFYAEQIQLWFSSMTDQEKSSPRSIDEFIAILSGRTPGMRPSAREIAKALRSLGWVRVRVWRGDAEGRRVWVPQHRSWA